MTNASPADAKVAAVIVTFNRRDMLEQCLDGLLAQDRPVDHVFIVNNASSDGTREFLDGRFGADPRFTLRHLDSNTGGAGGFHEGLKLAGDKGFDWYWLMDDDVIPLPDCLGKLLEYRDLSECIHPRKRHEDGSFFNWYGRFDPRSGRLKSISEDHAWGTRPYLEVNYGCFEGMLVSDAIVRRIGLPASEYFICYDDRIFGYLASNHTRVLYVKDAVMKKLIKKTRDSFSHFSFFYQVRNLFLLKRDLKRQGVVNPAKWAAYLISFVVIQVARALRRDVKDVKAVTTAFRGLKEGFKIA